MRLPHLAVQLLPRILGPPLEQSELGKIRLKFRQGWFQPRLLSWVNGRRGRRASIDPELLLAAL